MKSIKYIALAVAAAMLLLVFPSEFFAAPAAYDVWIDGIRLTESNADGVKCGMGTAVYSAEEALLTLTDTSIYKIHEETDAAGTRCASVYAAGDLHIAVYGENSVTSAFSMGHNALNCGVYCGGTLTITGTGTLNVTGGLSTYKTAGIRAEEIIIGDDVIVNASGGRLTSSVSTDAYGVYAAGNVTLTDNGSLAAFSYLPDSEFFPAVSAAVYCGATMLLEKNAGVTAEANRSEQNGGDALLLRGELSVSGGSLTAKSPNENGYGIRIDSDHPTPVTIISGFVFATGGRYALFSSYGKFSTHPEYRITGAAKTNAAETECDSAETVFDNGVYFSVTNGGSTAPAKSLYFVRPVIEYDVWVGGLRINNYNCADVFGDGRVSYEKETATLTLNGAQISGGRYNNAYLYTDEPLTLRLNDGGASTLGGFSHKREETAYGIYAANGLTVTGGGHLTIASGDAEKDAFGIYVRIGALKVTQSVLHAKAGNASENSAGIYVASTTSGDLTLSEMAAVTGTGGRAATMIGVSANGNISVTEASSLSGEGGNNPSSAESVSYGIRSHGSMQLDDASSVKGTGGDSGNFSIGVYALSSQEGIHIKGGKLSANSGEGAVKCYGLYAKTGVTLARGEIEAVSAQAAAASGSMSYAVTAKTIALTGGSVTATAGEAASSCGVYADTFTVSGSSAVTATSFDGSNSHALRKAPKYTSFAPVVYAGREAPGELVLKPTDATYANHTYIRIEKLFRSEKIWYALPIYDSAGKTAGRWVGFTSDDVTKLATIGAGIDGTGAAEYYNGYIYGVTNTLPFRFWRVKMDGAAIGSPEYVSDSVRFSFGDMSYDYVTDKMYGLGSFNEARAVFSIDLQTGATQRVASVSGTQAELLTMAFNREGACYGIDLAGVLYKIDLRTGKAEKIGATGLIPDGAQSMAFDRSTNELFWAYFNGKTGKSGFYYVDIETGRAVNAGSIGGNHMELAGLFTIPTPYDIWIGGVRVNEENAHDVFGNGLVSFDTQAETISFNGMKITTYAQAYKNYSFGVLVKDMDVNLVFNGENAIALQDVYTEHSASICIVNGSATISGDKLTILSTGARLDHTILCPDGLTIDGCELMVYSNHNAITVNNDGADLTIRNSTVGVNAAHIGMAAVNGDINVAGSTLAISADKDAQTPSCAAAAAGVFSLTDSTLLAQADTNVCVISERNVITESIWETSAPEQAVSGTTEFSHKNGTAVLVSNGKSEESRKYWDKTTPLTNYLYLKITECPHEYDSDYDTECNICGKVRYITPDGEVYTPGDVDADGIISSADARLALRCSVGLEYFSQKSASCYACDADRDDRVTSADARLILRASVGLESIQ